MPQNGPQVYMVTIKTCIFTNCLLWIGQRLLGRCSLYREMPLHIRLSGSSLTYILNWYDNCMKILLSNDIFTLACNAKKNNWSTRSCWILSSPVLPMSIFFARLSRGNTHTSWFNLINNLHVPCLTQHNGHCQLFWFLPVWVIIFFPYYMRDTKRVCLDTQDTLHCQ